MTRTIYMDNAATSFPKPPGVTEAMVHFMEHVGGNPGRSRSDRSTEASKIVEGTRKALSKLFNIADPDRIVFTLNATESLNTVIYGVLNQGDFLMSSETIRGPSDCGQQMARSISGWPPPPAGDR